MKATTRQAARTSEIIAAEVVTVYRQALDDLRRIMSRLYEKYAKTGELTYVEMTRYNRMTTLEKQISKILGPANSKAIRKIERLSCDSYDAAFFRTEWAIDSATTQAIRWGKLPEEAIREAVANPFRHISEKRLRANSILKIRSAVAEGLTQGQSYPDMASMIKDAINGTVYEALRIARTEGARSTTLGAQAALDRAKDRGVEVVQIWDATLDGRTRPTHQVLDQQPINDEHKGWYVPELGFYVPGPHQSGKGWFDCNCRCGISGEIEGLEPSLRRIKGEGVVPMTSYEKWRENMEKHGGVYKPVKKVTLSESEANRLRNIARRKR